MFLTYQDAIRSLVGPDAVIIVNGPDYKDINVEGAVKPSKTEADAELSRLELEGARKERLDSITTEFNNAMNALVAGYPEREISSWPQQEKEARAYLADNTAATPLLDALSTARGVDKAILAQKIVEKADAYAAAAGALIGKRQALEDQINAATTVDEVNAVVWS